MNKTAIGLKHIILCSILLMGVFMLWADRILAHEIGFQLGDRVFTETDPPVGPVRPVAEFEPASHVLIRYPLGIPVGLVTQLSNTAQVITIVANASNQTSATNAFSSAGVNMANVSFILAPTDSYWTRDFGPWFIVDGNNQFGVVDFRYNRPRPNDDAIPSIFAPAYNFNYFGMSLYQTGGNYMTDGINTAAQTQIAYSENSSQTQAQINQKMQSYLGVSNYFVINDPNNTYIDHIDCWGKFLAPDKVLIRSVPTTHSQYDEIEAVANFFASTNCAWNYPYRVYRVYTPQNQPYTNSLILNRKVFVPTMNSTYDNQALDVYRSALPGYEVIGVAGNASAAWESTDALHCRTHEIPDKEMLHISHTPYRGVYDFSNAIDLNVNIKAHSGSALYNDSLFVAYKINQGSWQRAYLTALNATSYTTMITEFAMGDTIRYFVHAADQSGRAIDHPYTAALDPHIFSLVGDQIAPNILHTPIESISNQEDPIVFAAIVSDNESVQSVIFEYKIDEESVQSMPMSYQSEDTWTCDFITNFVDGNQFFSYRIIASDAANPANTSIYPSANEWITVQIIPTSNQDALQHIIPAHFSNVYPNPFSTKQNRILNMDYQAKAGTAISIHIYNVRGQLIRSLSTIAKADGINRINWDGKDASGKIATGGLYLIQFKTDISLETKKIILGN